jgi:hypothetical protein
MTDTATLGREKLVKILGLLSSTHDGERASAGLLADRMLRNAGLRWEDLIPRQIGHDSRPKATRATPPPPPPLHWRHAASAVLRAAPNLTEWERRFLTSLLSQRRLSEKQLVILRKLATKVGAYV